MASNTNTNVDKLITFGKMALEQGWYDQARDYFAQALALDASDREAMKGLARANEILNRRASFEPIKRGVPPAKPAGKGHPIAEWVRGKRRAYDEWVGKRRWQRERTAEARLAAEERRREEMVELEAEQYRGWYWTGVADWEVEYGVDDLAAVIFLAELAHDDIFGDFF